MELRQSKQPMLSDLRESGSLEQDADIVMFLYREDYYKGADDTPSHITELIVAKHRNGSTGRVTLFFKEDCTKFTSLVKRKRQKYKSKKELIQSSFLLKNISILFAPEKNLIVILL